MEFLIGWLLVLGQKECLVECAKLCVKSLIILLFRFGRYNKLRIDKQELTFLYHFHNEKPLKISACFMACPKVPFSKGI